MKKAFIVFLLLSTSFPAFAERIVFVNGVRMAPQQLELIDRLACSQVPNGNYWLNTANGVWGYVGSPTPQGQITGNCTRWNGVSANDSNGNYHSLSERGMLYSPSELLR